MRFAVATADRQELPMRVRLLEATIELKSALQRYATLIDQIEGRKGGTTIRMINRVLQDCVGLPIHNVVFDEFDDSVYAEQTKRLHEALEQLAIATGQVVQISIDDYIIDVKSQMEAIGKQLGQKCKRKAGQKQTYPKVKTKCNPIPGYTRKTVWNRTRSNPKLR